MKNKLFIGVVSLLLVFASCNTGDDTTVAPVSNTAYIGNWYLEFPLQNPSVGFREHLEITDQNFSYREELKYSYSSDWYLYMGEKYTLKASGHILNFKRVQLGEGTVDLESGLYTGGEDWVDYDTTEAPREFSAKWSVDGDVLTFILDEDSNGFYDEAPKYYTRM